MPCFICFIRKHSVVQILQWTKYSKLWLCVYRLWCRLCQTFYRVVGYRAPLPPLVRPSHPLEPYSDLQASNHEEAIVRLRFWGEHLTAYGLLAYSKNTSSKDMFMLEPSLLTALVDHWRPETHTFHIRCGELASILKDVSLITDLPINGKSLVPVAYSNIWLYEVSCQLGM
jgi:hypothetical protein